VQGWDSRASGSRLNTTRASQRRSRSESCTNKLKQRGGIGEKVKGNSLLPSKIDGAATKMRDPEKSKDRRKRKSGEEGDEKGRPERSRNQASTDRVLRRILKV